MRTKMFKLNPIRAAIMGVAVMASGNAAMAAPVYAELDFTCPFPLIGDQIITAKISADYPEQLEIDVASGESTVELPPVFIDVITVVPDKARQGLAFVDAVSVEGVAHSINTFNTVSGPVANNTDLIIEKTEIPSDQSGPFDVPASGDSPAQVFDDSHIGVVSLTVDDLVMDMIARKADGSIAPAPVGDFSADCTLNPGQDNVLTTFEVVVPDAEPDIDVTPMSVNFGDKLVGETASQAVTIKNTGGGILGISSIGLTGSNEFSEVNNCTTLAAGESCTATITYTVSEEGVQNASLVIDSTDTDPEEATISVDIKGTGTVVEYPEIDVTPTSIDFGVITENETRTETVVISNIGTAPLFISGVDIEGAAEFETSTNCSTVAAASSCSETVTYTAVVGQSTGTVVIASNDEDEALSNVSLTGTGIELVPPTCEEDPTLPGCEVPPTCEDDPTLPGCEVPPTCEDDPTLPGCEVPPTCEDDPTLPGCSDDFIIPVDLDVEGSTYIAANRGTIPLNGLISSQFNLTQGSFTGDMHLDPTSGSFEIIQGWKRYLATAQIEFEPVGITEGTLVDGKLIATSSAYVKLPKVTKTLFGLVNWKIGGGSDCRTVEPATFTITSADGEYFDALAGGQVTGTYTLPKLENCGILTSILSSKLAGPGNTIELTLTPNLD